MLPGRRCGREGAYLVDLLHVGVVGDLIALRVVVVDVDLRRDMERGTSDQQTQPRPTTQACARDGMRTHARVYVMCVHTVLLRACGDDKVERWRTSMMRVRLLE